MCVCVVVCVPAGQSVITAACVGLLAVMWDCNLTPAGIAVVRNALELQRAFLYPGYACAVAASI